MPVTCTVTPHTRLDARNPCCGAIVWVAMSSALRHSRAGFDGPLGERGRGGKNMPSFEFATNQVALPAWAAGAVVALFVVIAVLTLTRSGASIAGALLRVAVVAVGCAAAWMLIQQGTLRDRAAERRALDRRVAELTARAVVPGTALACLDAVAGDTVETACEKQVFANPEGVAAAVSYVSARLTLLADAVDFARRSGERYEAGLATMRLSLETDRYGFVAHVLSMRDSCTPLLCDSYALFKDPDRVQANLRERLYERYVDRYAPEWAARAAAPAVAAAAPGNAYTTASGPTVPAPAPVPSKYDFPSAASIPAVSIMTAEPGTSPDPKTATAPPPPPAPPRRVVHAPPRPPARPATAPPQQIAPAPSASAAPAAH